MPLIYYFEQAFRASALSSQECQTDVIPEDNFDIPLFVVLNQSSLKHQLIFYYFLKYNYSKTLLNEPSVKTTTHV